MVYSRRSDLDPVFYRRSDRFYRCLPVVTSAHVTPEGPVSQDVQLPLLRTNHEKYKPEVILKPAIYGGGTSVDHTHGVWADALPHGERARHIDGATWVSERERLEI